MIVYWPLWAALRVIFLLGLRVRVQGLDNVPRSGPFVLCSNHVSWLDPMLLGAILPRQVFYMAKHEIFVSPPAALLLRTVGAFPVRRHYADRRALRWALQLLRRGRAVAVFPEGTRSRDGRLGPGEPGAALLAVSSGARIVPAAICGAYRPGELEVRFGAPFHLPIPPGTQRLTAAQLRALANEHIMGRVAALIAKGCASVQVVAAGRT